MTTRQSPSLSSGKKSLHFSCCRCPGHTEMMSRRQISACQDLSGFSCECDESRIMITFFILPIIWLILFSLQTVSSLNLWFFISKSKKKKIRAMYIRRSHLPELTNYKYAGVDKSLTSRYVLKPFYTNVVIKCFPLWMAYVLLRSGLKRKVHALWFDKYKKQKIGLTANLSCYYVRPNLVSFLPLQRIASAPVGSVYLIGGTLLQIL